MYFNKNLGAAAPTYPKERLYEKMVETFNQEMESYYLYGIGKKELKQALKQEKEKQKQK